MYQTPPSAHYLQIQGEFLRIEFKTNRVIVASKWHPRSFISRICSYTTQNSLSTTDWRYDHAIYTCTPQDLKVAGLKKNTEMDHYLEDIMSNCFQRREKVRSHAFEALVHARLLDVL